MAQMYKISVLIWLCMVKAWRNKILGVNCANFVLNSGFLLFFRLSESFLLILYDKFVNFLPSKV